VCTLGTAAVVIVHISIPFVIYALFRCLMRHNPRTKFFFYLCLCTAFYLFYVYQKHVVGLLTLQKVCH
jgi:hypothetical protein